MPSTDALPVLRDLLAAQIDPPEAAKRLLALNGPAAVGLAHLPNAFSADDTARLGALMAAVRWEMAKQLSPGRLPDVAYGSPEYQQFIAALPSGPSEPPEPAG
jgi:hypothetical protein